MSEFTPLVKSHPSSRVRQLLASAELDVPKSGGKDRALASVSRHYQHAATTNFSGVALGTTVHRLIGAVTLYGSAASPWRLVARGGLMGAAAGAMALAIIVAVRWTEAPAAETSVAGQTISASPDGANISPNSVTPEANAASELVARDFALLRGAAIELDSARPEAALESINALLRGTSNPRVVPQAMVLKIKALLRLGRIEEAEVSAKHLLESPPCPESHEVRALLEAHRSAQRDASAK